MKGDAKRRSVDVVGGEHVGWRRAAVDGDLGKVVLIVERNANGTA